jgi:hypothetical protein
MRPHPAVSLEVPESGSKGVKAKIGGIKGSLPVISHVGMHHHCRLRTCIAGSSPFCTTYSLHCTYMRLWRYTGVTSGRRLQ